jgi:hypothetical protein
MASPETFQQLETTAQVAVVAVMVVAVVEGML